MVIVYDSFNKVLIITAPEIADFVTNSGAIYTGITITTNITCGNPIVQTYAVGNTSSPTNKFYIVGNNLYINPSLYGFTDYIDGIYKLDIKFNKTTGYILISNCKFIDVTLKCKVASLLQNIIGENKIADNEKVSTIIHLLHYSLVNGSNCGCNCAEMCAVYTELLTLLNSIDPSCFCTNAALGSVVGGSSVDLGGVPETIEIAHTFADISTSTNRRIIYVEVDETNNGDYTEYLYTGSELKFIQIVP